MRKRFSSWRLRAVRETAGMSREQLSNVVGCGHHTVARWECGYTTPNANHLAAIADALGCPIEQFFVEGD